MDLKNVQWIQGSPKREQWTPNDADDIGQGVQHHEYHSGPSLQASSPLVRSWAGRLKLSVMTVLP